MMVSGYISLIFDNSYQLVFAETTL